MKLLNNEETFQTVGLYENKFNFEESAQYKEQIDNIRQQQKWLVQGDVATTHRNDWTVNGSLSEGKKMNKENIKLILRAFNNECDYAIAKVKYNNINMVEKRIRKAFETLNKVSNEMIYQLR